jgi:hypothetical protein
LSAKNYEKDIAAPAGMPGNGFSGDISAVFTIRPGSMRGKLGDVCPVEMDGVHGFDQLIIGDRFNYIGVRSTRHSGYRFIGFQVLQLAYKY